MKRARPRVSLLVATFGVVLLLAALSVGLSTYLAGSATAGARAGLAALTGSSGGFRITIPLASDAAAQDVRVQREIHDSVRSDGRVVPLRVVRDVETLDTVELDGPRGVARSALASIPGLSTNADLVAGTWPTDAATASMQADAAAALGVRLGDRFALPGGAHITIVGTWRVRNASDPIWLGSGLPLSGVGYAGVAGFVVIDPSLWAASGAKAVARWTVIPQASQITASQLPAIQSATDTVPLALLADSRNGTSVDQDGRLQPAMSPIVTNVQAAAAVSIAPLVIVAVLGIVTLTELARMLTQLRAGETDLLTARGATRRRLVVTAAVESAAVAVPGAVVGAALALAILPLVTHASSVPPIGWLGACLAAIVAVIVFAGGAGLASPDVSARTAAAGEQLRSAAGIAVLGLTILAAIVSVSQFLLYGSPLTTTASGGVAVDPLAVAAPALALAALSLVGLALFPLVSRAAERLGGRLVGLFSLSVRQLARRDRAAITPLLLVALAVAGLVFASAYSGTWHASAEATRAVQVGTDVRVVGQSGPPVTAQAIPGQLAAAPAATTDVQVGDDQVSMIQLPVDRLRDVVAPVARAVDPRALERSLSDPVARPQLPAGAHGLEVHILAVPVSAAPSDVDVTVVDGAGTLTTLRGTTSDRGVFVLPLPAGVAPWVMRAIDVQMPAVKEGARVSFTIRAMGSESAVPLGAGWTLSDLTEGHPGFAAITGSAPGVRATAATEGSRLRLQPLPARGTRLPVVVSDALAKSAGLRVGLTLDLPVVGTGGDVPAVVAGIVPVIPGLTADEGVLADLGAVQDATLRGGLRSTVVTERWIATADPRAMARRLESRVSVGAVILTRESVPADEVLGSANNVVWLAALAIALLGLLAVGAGLVAETRARTNQVSLLRALGVSRRVQSRGRAIEVGTVLALGLIAGLVDGVIVSALIVPDLARTAVPGALEALPTVLTVDVIAGVSSVVAVTVLAAGLLLGIAAAVRRQAGSAPSEEGRP
jgi:ABC-type lipoprotein release transport system permease subunit